MITSGADVPTATPQSQQTHAMPGVLLKAKTKIDNFTSAKGSLL